MDFFFGNREVRKSSKLCHSTDRQADDKDRRVEEPYTKTVVQQGTAAVETGVSEGIRALQQ